MNFKLIATEISDYIKYETSINEINRIANAIFKFSRQKFPNNSITSVRAQLVYDWILTLETYKCSDDKKKELLVNFVRRLHPNLSSFPENYEFDAVDENTLNRSDAYQFHPEINKHCRKLYSEGYYFHAVSEAVKVYNSLVKSYTQIKADGQDLMMKAWTPNGGMLKSKSSLSETDINFYEGIKFLSAGLIRAFRNPTAHEPALDWPIDEQDASDILALVSFLLRQYDKAVYSSLDSEEFLESSVVVSIPDLQVAAEVRDRLGLGVDEPITTEGLQNLTTLNLTDGIVEFTGLEHAVNLAQLEVLGVHPLLSDVRPLANLTKLTNLFFANNAVSDISVLENLTNLTRFGISGTQVSDFSVLANLTNLTELHLGSSTVSDISVLENLTNLTKLELFNLRASDISVLADLTNLTELRILNSAVSDVSGIRTLINLEHLKLRWNQISNIAPLVANIGLGSGDTVDLRNNPLDAVSVNTHIPVLRARGVMVEY